MIEALKYPVAVWLNKDEGKFYAYPLGAKDILGDPMFANPPILGDGTWESKGTVPQGTPVHGVKSDEGDRVTCRLGAWTVFTARWAIIEMEG